MAVSHELVRLYDLLSDTFSEGELRTLAFDLNIEYEDLPGTTRASRLRELILFADRRGRLTELIAYAARARPGRERDFLEIIVNTESKTATTHSASSYNIGNIGTTATQGSGVSIGLGNVVQISADSFAQLLENKEEILASLNYLLQQIGEAIEEGAFSDQRAGLIALENVQDIEEELSKDRPRARWIELRLVDTRNVLMDNYSVEAGMEASRSVEDSIEVIEGLLSALRKALSD